MLAALNGIRVLDISQGIAGPLCARILADLGADVIKIEPPDGELGRAMPPFKGDDPDPEKSLFFLLLNLNKRGITLDLESAEGRRVFHELAKDVDVIVETSRPGHLAPIGLDHATLDQDDPGLVMTSITPFGQTGPYSQHKGEEIVTYAMSGVMSVSGTSDREPLKHGGFQAQYEAGMTGAVSTAFTLLLRDMTGQGQHIDISAQEVVASTLVINQPYFSWTGAVQGRRKPEGTMFGNIMPCKDGYFIAQPGGGATWDRVAEFFGREELKEERFANVEQRLVNAAEMDEIVIDAAKDRTMAEMFKTGSEEFRMLLGMAQTPEDLANCPQLEARDFYQEVDHPVIGSVKVPSSLLGISEPVDSHRSAAPLLGQHNDEVYAEALGYTADQLADLKQRGVV